jgi:thiamine biosynthesis lipoprotein
MQRSIPSNYVYVSLLAGVLLGLLVRPNIIAQDIIAQENESNLPASDSLPPIVGYESSFSAMGTTVQLKAFHRDSDVVARAFEAVESRVRELEAILTDYDPASETRRLSELAPLRPTPVSQPLWELLEACDRWHKLSHGAFDASLGGLTQLWRKYRRSSRLPTPDQISAARARTGWQHVQLDASARSIYFDKPELRLDFGAIGKGYIVDQAFEILCAADLPCSLINISGNMRAGAAPPERFGWRIEIAPLEPGSPPLRQVQIANQSIATSGDLWQFVLIDGVRHSHILDPHTGMGVVGPRCATAIAPTATDADALATTACIVGFDAAAEIAQQLAQIELLCADRIDENAVRSNAAVDVHTTAGFPPDIRISPTR